MKDPAFLFYSKDFYEGTRLMLPEERACFIDLLIYQHQNGLIPLETKRVLMYCSGVDEATLKATLEAKFKQTDKGWFNERLRVAISQRKDYAERQSQNGKFGQFVKKVNQSEDPVIIEMAKTLKPLINSKKAKEFILKSISEPSYSLQATLQGLLKHLAIANANAIVNENIDKGGVGENRQPQPAFQKPTLDEVKSYFKFLSVPEAEIKLIAEKFFNHYESVGWMLSENRPLRNWKARAQTWISENQNRKNTSHAKGKINQKNSSGEPLTPSKSKNFWDKE